MKNTYQNPNTEISWWVGDRLCAKLGESFLPPGVPGGNDSDNQLVKSHPSSSVN